MKKFFALFLCLLLGCSPNLKLERKNYIKIPSTYLESANPEESDSGRWWTRFKDKHLENILEQIKTSSLDLQKSSLALQILKKQYEQELSTLYPQIDLKGSVIREGKYISSLTGDKKYSLGNTYSLSLYASYELDLFQKLSQQRQSAWHTFLQGKYEQIALRQSLLTEGTSLYLNIAFLKYKKELLTKLLKLAQTKYQLAQLNYSQGISELSTLLNFENLVEQRKNELLALENTLKSKIYALSLLLAQYPREDIFTSPWSHFSLDVLQVNPGLPSSLLKRRPDILAQEEKLAELEAKAQIARKARFPQITLTATFGYSSTELKNLFTPESSLWNLALGLVQPIFQAGKLKKAEEIAILNFRKEEIEYANTLLTAFKEVEEVLNWRKILLEQRQNLEQYLKNQKKSLELAKIKYEYGQLSLLELKEREENYLQTKLEMEENKLNLLLNQINLVKALGGDW
jgi:multidrug efflux system outer membrane protein